MQIKKSDSTNFGMNLRVSSELNELLTSPKAKSCIAEAASEIRAIGTSVPVTLKITRGCPISEAERGTRIQLQASDVFQNGTSADVSHAIYTGDAEPEAIVAQPGFVENVIQLASTIADMLNVARKI